MPRPRPPVALRRPPMIIGPGDPEKEHERAEAAKAERRRAKKARKAERAARRADEQSRPATDGPDVVLPVQDPLSEDALAREPVAPGSPGRDAATAPGVPPTSFDGAPAPVGVPAGAPADLRPAGVPRPPALAVADARVEPVALVARIDRLRDRVGTLLGLVDDLEGRTADTPGRPRETATADRAAGGTSAPGEDGPADAGSGLRASDGRSGLHDPDGGAGFGASDAAPTVGAASLEVAAGPGTPETAPTARPAPAPPATATLVARELLASGMAREDVLRRLHEAYGVAEPEAALRAAG